MNQKEWGDYVLNLYKVHLMLGGRDETFPAHLENIGICSECIRNNSRCECEVK